MENLDNKLTYIDEDGNEVLCEILFTFNSEDFGKNYVLFYPVGSEDENGMIDLMAASYKELEDGTCGELENVETDEEWDLIEEMLDEYTKENDDCECCDDDCCCHDDCCCEDDDEEECECGCHHHEK